MQARRLSAAQLAAWERDGVLVVEDVVPPAVCAAAVSSIEHFVAKDAEDSSVWASEPGLRYHGLVSNNQAQALYDTRQHPELHSVFAQLLGTDALLVSADASNFTPPASEAWSSEQHIHWDMNSSSHIHDPHLTGVQGVLCLTDCLENQGGLVCAPGFHHRLADWAQSESVSPHRNDQIPTLADVSSMQLRHVGARAGSIIIWNSALPHSNSRNTALKPRIAQYITFSRAPASTQFVPAPIPLARSHFDIIADALGVPAGSVSDWLHYHAQSDLIDVPCRSVECMPMQDGVAPYWLRVRIDGREQPVDLHTQWSSISATTGAYEDRRDWGEVAMPPLEYAVSLLNQLNGDEKVLAAIEPDAWTPAIRTAVGAAALLLGFNGWAKTLDGIGRNHPSRDPSLELCEMLRREIAEQEQGWLLARTLCFDKDNVPANTLAALQKYTDKADQKPRFLTKGAFYEEVAGKSRTAAALWAWVIAIDTYTKCYKLQDGDTIPTLSRTYHQLREWEQTSVPVQWPYLHHFELSESQQRALMEEQSVENAARLDASISLVPKHADFVGRKGVTASRLNEEQLSQLSVLLLSEAPWNRADKRSERVWTSVSVAELIGRHFGWDLVDLTDAKLSPLGRRLTGVEPWPAPTASNASVSAQSKSAHL